MTRRTCLLAVLAFVFATPAFAQTHKARRPTSPPVRPGSECEIVIFGDESKTGPWARVSSAAQMAQMVKAGAFTADSLVETDANGAREGNSVMAWHDATASGDAAALNRLVANRVVYRITKGDHAIAEFAVGPTAIRCRVISGASTGAEINLQVRNLRSVESIKKGTARKASRY